MGVLIQGIEILFGSMLGTINAFVEGILKMLPAIMQLNKLQAIFSPAGAFLLLFGVPLSVIPFVVKLIKKICLALKN
jgi:hypothetical protein